MVLAETEAATAMEEEELVEEARGSTRVTILSATCDGAEEEEEEETRLPLWIVLLLPLPICSRTTYREPRTCPSREERESVREVDVGTGTDLGGDDAGTALDSENEEDDDEDETRARQEDEGGDTKLAAEERRRLISGLAPT